MYDRPRTGIRMVAGARGDAQEDTRERQREPSTDGCHLAMLASLDVPGKRAISPERVRGDVMNHEGRGFNSAGRASGRPPGPLSKSNSW